MHGHSQLPALTVAEPQSHEYAVLATLKRAPSELSSYQRKVGAGGVLEACLLHRAAGGTLTHSPACSAPFQPRTATTT
jgi:hypothetical protein